MLSYTGWFIKKRKFTNYKYYTSNGCKIPKKSYQENEVDLYSAEQMPELIIAYFGYKLYCLYTLHDSYADF